MPELPEVETIRRGLEANILAKPISKVEISLPKIIKGDPQTFQTTLEDKSFQAINRRGKLMMFALTNSDLTMLLHLKMTGQIIYPRPTTKDRVTGGHPYPDFNTKLPSKFTHVQFHFEDGTTLFYNDMRQFGYLQLVTPAQKETVQQKFGVEPLSPEFTLDKWRSLIANRRGKLKPFLLNQKYVAGIGNIYADEIAWYAQVNPNQELNTLSAQQITDLYQGIKKILAEAVQHHGTTFSDYTDDQGNEGGYASKLKVFGREDQPCPRCQTIIEKIKVAGRGTHFCPRCQAYQETK